VSVIVTCLQAETLRAHQPAPQSRLEDGGPGKIAAAVGERTSSAQPARGLGPPDIQRRPALKSDDSTYRPTVVVRRGTSQGSGTIIASVDGETLVLTAAHVVQDRGPIVVELHRYNLGFERTPAAPGRWPRPVRASLLAKDAAADLAVLRIVKLRALPYVARLARDHVDPPAGSVVSSIGIDLGTNLTSWSTRVVETFSFELNESKEQRPFLITEKIPEHGRSGGGLYLAGGELVGVCVGHAELVRGKRMGVFASRESIRLLLVDRKLSETIARSESIRGRRRNRSPQVTAAAHKPSSSAATSSEFSAEKQPSARVP
jgi:S1-C subfamily serine protease